MKAIEIIEKLYNIDFNSNTFADKKHEGSVKSILIACGLSEIKKVSKPTKNKPQSPEYLLITGANKLEIVEELKGQFLFIDQPFGSQQQPDFIICIDGMIIWIECKSSDNGKVVWNTGYPKKDVLVVCSAKKDNKTAVFFGQHSELLVKNPNFETMYEDFDKKMKKICNDSFNELFDTEHFSFYMRKMLNDSTKYVANREDFYSKVVDILNEKESI